MASGSYLVIGTLSSVEVYLDTAGEQVVGGIYTSVLLGSKYWVPGATSAILAYRGGDGVLGLKRCAVESAFWMCDVSGLGSDLGLDFDLDFLGLCGTIFGTSRYVVV